VRVGVVVDGRRGGRRRDRRVHRARPKIVGIRPEVVGIRPEIVARIRAEIVVGVRAEVVGFGGGTRPEVLGSRLEIPAVRGVPRREDRGFHHRVEEHRVSGLIRVAREVHRLGVLRVVWLLLLLLLRLLL
jgi:hypothetical protein